MTYFRTRVRLPPPPPLSPNRIRGIFISRAPFPLSLPRQDDPVDESLLQSPQRRDACSAASLKDPGVRPGLEWPVPVRPASRDANRTCDAGCGRLADRVQPSWLPNARGPAPSSASTCDPAPQGCEDRGGVKLRSPLTVQGNDEPRAQRVTRATAWDAPRGTRRNPLTNNDARHRLSAF